MPAKTIPVTLTERDWTKKKGLIAKAAVKTGITDALRKFKAAFDKVDWNDLDPNLATYKSTKKITAEVIDDLWQDAQGEWRKVQTVANALLTVEQAASGAEAKYKAAKIHIPDSSKKAVKAIGAEAKRFSTELMKIDDEWKAYKKQIATKDKRDLQEALDRIKEYPGLLRGYEKEIRKSPTVKTFDSGAKTGFFQNMRGLNAALANSKNEKLIAWAKTNWRPLVQAAPKKDSEVIDRMEKALAKVKEMESLIKTLG